MHDRRMLGRSGRSVTLLDRQSVKRDSQAVEIRRMTGEIVGMSENVGRRRLKNIEKKADVLLLDSPGSHRGCARRMRGERKDQQ